MRFPALILIAGLLAGWSSTSAQAASQREELLRHFSLGNQAYLEDDYEKAVQEYRKVLETGGQHPDLYYNLANAYYRSGRRGLAVLFYEKALDMAPSDPAATSNLAIVRKELIDRVILPESGSVGEPMWHGFIRGISWGLLNWTFFTLYLLCFAVMIAKRLLRLEATKRLLFWINIPLLSLAVVFGVLMASRIYIQEKVHHGVVVAMTTSLREGPERTTKEIMQLHEGLKVRLLNEVGDHIRVRLANGVEGFLQASHLGRI